MVYFVFVDHNYSVSAMLMFQLLQDAKPYVCLCQVIDPHLRVNMGHHLVVAECLKRVIRMQNTHKEL